jgi:hypothetical protein
MTTAAQPGGGAATPNQPLPARAGRGVLPALAHLTARDLQIAQWLDQHGVLTTAQIAGALFTSDSRASHRLLQLWRLGLIDRFHRPNPGGGFGPWHWVIGALGARLAAAAHNRTPPTACQLALRHERLAASPTLAHLLGANQFFLDLHNHARASADHNLLRWWSERDTARRYSNRIHPDGHALWQHRRATIGLFLEFDTGSEHFDRVLRRLAAYDQMVADGGPAYPVLFWLHSAHREVNLQTALAAHPTSHVCVATGVRGRYGGPADTVWLLHGDTRRRMIDELPSHHGDPSSSYSLNLNDPTLNLQP